MTRPHDHTHRVDELERLVDEALRELGQRQAPSTLEVRVLAELSRRAALPWWRKSFAYWPLAGRGIFLLVSIGCIELAVGATMWAFGRVDVPGMIAQGARGMRTLADLSSSLTDLALALIRLIPSGWLYGGVACCALLYVALLALGALGYHLLYAVSNSRGTSRR